MPKPTIKLGMKVVFWMLAACALHAQAISEWAFGGPDHRLHYRYDARGNSIMDFSSAGYRGGGVKLPSAVAAQRLTPAAGDNTARIQAALDNATGAVVLAAGEYEIAGTLCITRSGVVLRGEKGAGHTANGQAASFPGNPRRGHVARGRCSRADPRRLCAGRRQYFSGSRRLGLPSRRSRAGAAPGDRRMDPFHGDGHAGPRQTSRKPGSARAA